MVISPAGITKLCAKSRKKHGARGEEVRKEVILWSKAVIHKCWGLAQYKWLFLFGTFYSSHHGSPSCFILPCSPQPWHEYLCSLSSISKIPTSKVDISLWDCNFIHSPGTFSIYSSICKMTYRSWDPTGCLFTNLSTICLSEAPQFEVRAQVVKKYSWFNKQK